MKTMHKQTILNEQGLVSIIVTMLMMLILSLIVVGFANIVRRDQRQILDRQLSTQAFYAAESGINDAMSKLNANASLLNPANDYDGCDGFTSATGLDKVISPDGLMSYSCLLVDLTPGTLEFIASQDISKTFPVESKNPASTIQSITVSWQQKEGNVDFTCGTAGNFPIPSSWPCNTPLMRMDLVRTDQPTRFNLNNQQMTRFLFPVAGGGASTATYQEQSVASNAAAVAPVNCNITTTPRYCSVVINMPPGLHTGVHTYYLRLKALYQSASVVVTAHSAPSGGGTQLELKNAQVVIDSTGKANDVLRRMQVRAPINGGIIVPEFAIQSKESICKRLEVTGSSANPIFTNGDDSCNID